MTSPLSGAGEANKPKLLDQVRQLMRLRHFSLRTEEAYLGWIRRYILFHGRPAVARAARAISELRRRIKRQRTIEFLLRQRLG
jgi:hypothetical protein